MSSCLAGSWTDVVTGLSVGGSQRLAHILEVSPVTVLARAMTGLLRGVGTLRPSASSSRSPWTTGPPDPIPAHCRTPDGVDGRAEVVDHVAFAWIDAGWRRPADRSGALRAARQDVHTHRCAAVTSAATSSTPPWGG